MPDDPFHNGHEVGTVHVHTCYCCSEVHGCLVLIGRTATFQDSCEECCYKDKPDCKARSSAKISEMPVICEACSHTTS